MTERGRSRGLVGKIEESENEEPGREIEFITYKLWDDLFPGQKPPDQFRPRARKIVAHLQESAEKDERVIPLQ